MLAGIFDAKRRVRHAYNGEGYHAGPLKENYNLPEHQEYVLWVCLVDGPYDDTGFDCEYTTIYS